MHIQLVLKTLGLVLLFEAAAMVPSLFISIFYQEAGTFSFLVGITAAGLAGCGLYLVPVKHKNVGYREGFAIATFSWLLLALFGAIPFAVAGAVPGYIDAVFETMSGFTTTGASVIPNVEILPKSILFWRSLTHWLGGMGIIVLTLALIPSLNIAGMQLFKAEVPGPTKSKVLPRIAQTSRQLYKVYVFITLIQVAALKLAGLSWFDSFIHTFGSVATGGFSNYNASVGHFQSLAVETIIIFFMVLSGINFALHYYWMRGDCRPLWQDYETRLFLTLILCSTAVISVNLFIVTGHSPAQAVREALFTVCSLITTTGYATADYDQWPALSKFILLFLMFVGGCAGSTGGGLKVGRLLILTKAFSRQLMRLIHPKAVIPVRIGQDVVAQEVVESAHVFFTLYMMLFALGTAVLAALGLDLVSAASAAAANLGNVGPGLGLVGPMFNYADLPDLGKMTLTFLMLVGRLEIYTVLLVFSVKFWR
ncbi:TrkH family potassium uptake protein [Desulforamulus hydrothermalis]|uniref:Potassium uptake protein, TrkH family n=1 Tax=Desulforamulus hydrothermalis Lam5 = DSM 18033 TaxID=1121428 RepID=K8EHI1_9FIRM|nr:TrkH family potassium uptake protein [Desulforamulus hydrothermalis]CCO08101.1 Potassium uptake protein, TrkH family [Desulforamulus hydrothermalis Lam5 = DSM 18033]SHG81991.1 trk system potassium uptake protein TrkH [Desulforamulus hydrothermalis Lam5 = DSM 18033]